MTIDVALIRESFEAAKPIADQIVNKFYDNLFTDFPQSKNLFIKVDMVNQKAALLQALVIAVNNLDNPEKLTRFLLQLGERHIKYGVEEIHYEWVGQSLLKTFGQFFGKSWTDELQKQWALVYGFISDTMKEGARQSVQSHNQNTQTKEVNIEIPNLSEDLKVTIQKAIKSIVLKQIRIEIQKCIKEEINVIEHMTPEELIARAIK